MTRRRRIRLLPLLLVVAALSSPASAHAWKSWGGPYLQIVPANPTTSQAITIKIRDHGSMKPGTNYQVTVTSFGGSTFCAPAENAPVAGVLKRGWTTRVTIPIPQARSLRSDQATQWCPGLYEVQVTKPFGPDGSRTGIASRKFRISKDGVGPAIVGPTVHADLLPTSTIKVTGPSRPVRKMSLGGELSWILPDLRRANKDYLVDLKSTTLTLRGLAVDPLCAGQNYATSFGLATDVPSQAWFWTTGGVGIALKLNVTPQSLAGCSGPATGSTTVQLRGDRVFDSSPDDLVLKGAVEGIPIATDVVATASVTLHLKLDGDNIW